MHTHRRLLAASVGLLAWLLTAGVARAEWNSQPIAVPAIGTSGQGTPFPSTITVAPKAGSLHKGQIYVLLHAVTHPCPEDLAVLLVHNHAEKYLLMSNAGGCHPLQGTDLWF